MNSLDSSAAGDGNRRLFRHKWIQHRRAVGDVARQDVNKDLELKKL